MVAALFGCLLRRGGARAAEAGRVISVGRVSVPRECGLQGARGRAKLAPPLARRPEAESCGSGGRWGSQRARGRALCARALLSACILGGLAVRVSGCCVSVFLVPVLENVSVCPPACFLSVYCVYFLRACDFEGVYYLYVRVCVSDGLCVCPSVCLRMCGQRVYKEAACTCRE